MKGKEHSMPEEEKLSRSEQARVNGAKSKGPTSAEGKAKSSANALKHGFAAVVNVVLRIEDRAAFEQHVAQFRQSFEIGSYAEQSLVDQLAAIQWRQSRLVGLETALIDAQIGIQNATLHEMYPLSADDQAFHPVKAWQALAHQPPRAHPDDPAPDPTVPTDGYDVSSLELVRRYQVSLDRQFRNTLMNLRQLRKDLAPSGVAAQPSTDSASSPAAPQKALEPNEPKKSETLAQPPSKPPLYADRSHPNEPPHQVDNSVKVNPVKRR